jgi:phosphoribosylamine--glycine ligase
MGAYSPVDLPAELVERTMATVVQPVLDQMEAEGSPFRGFLYAGLVLSREGPKVLEFNVRLGDPETQALLPRLESDLVDVLEGEVPVWSAEATVNVVLAAEGYPEAPSRGAVISGLDGEVEGAMVFHAGTRRDGKRIVVDGGRVISVVGTGTSLEQARDRAYERVGGIGWRGMHFRTDIAG